MYSEITNNKSVAYSLYLYDMFRPVIGYHQVLYSLHDTEKYIRTRLSFTEVRHNGHINIIIPKSGVMLK